MHLLPFDFAHDPYVLLDFSANNPDLSTLDLTNTGTFARYVSGKLREAGAVVGVGGYAEDRVIYRNSGHFTPTDEEPRTIHLGVDFWADAGTPVFAPVDGIIHSFADNARYADYGPTIILEHQTAAADHGGFPRYSLYGHLSRASLADLYEGKVVKAGEKLAELGPYPENGDWPPHLHFQLMHDILGLRGDFPGVCRESERDYWLGLCPDPNPFVF
ncbi:peptidoglycan DD-metalloendopeptidase family protein [uncultured Fibrella sp.]|uniref:peptidoglycan DD-metalloendopeptidase family protein n=1 Tax=uncultured Fibrella sp. TaxID=1284596 RepID=UPI0035C96408